jgi:hypothetical protein
MNISDPDSKPKPDQKPDPKQSSKKESYFQAKKVISDNYGIFQHFQGIIDQNFDFCNSVTSNWLTDNRIIDIHCPVTFCAGVNFVTRLRSTAARARIFKSLWSTGIHSKE